MGARQRRPPTYRVRSADLTPPGVHLAGPRSERSSAHGRPPGATGTIVRYGATAVAVFALALLLVTGIEVVIGEPLSGGAPGHTSLGDVLHPASVP